MKDLTAYREKLKSASREELLREKKILVTETERIENGSDISLLDTTIDPDSEDYKTKLLALAEVCRTIASKTGNGPTITGYAGDGSNSAGPAPGGSEEEPEEEEVPSAAPELPENAAEENPLLAALQQAAKARAQAAEKEQPEEEAEDNKGQDQDAGSAFLKALQEAAKAQGQEDEQPEESSDERPMQPSLGEAKELFQKQRTPENLNRLMAILKNSTVIYPEDGYVNSEDGGVYIPIFSSRDTVPEEYRETFNLQALPFEKCIEVAEKTDGAQGLALDPFSDPLIIPLWRARKLFPPRS